MTVTILLSFNIGGNAAAAYYSVIKRVEKVLLLEEKEEIPFTSEIRSP